MALTESGKAARLLELTDEQKLAYIMSRSACMNAQIAAMQAANMQRVAAGQSLAYNEGSFDRLPEHMGLDESNVLIYLTEGLPT